MNSKKIQTYQNLGAARRCSERKSQLQTTMKKEERPQVNDLNFHLKEVGKG